MCVKKGSIDYQALVHRALRGTVRDILQQVAKDGLQGDQHYYITFKTDFEGVILPNHLKAKYPREMTIVIQHRFWNLKTESDGFQISLTFNQKNETLVIPFDSIVSLVDPSVRFALQFETEVTEEEQPPLLKQSQSVLTSSQENQPVTAAAGSTTRPSGNVVALDTFRKN